MRKLISLASALALCLSMAGGLAQPDRTGAPVMTAAAAEEAVDLDAILPTKYKEMQDFIKENGTVSIHGKYVVFCGNIYDYAVNKNMELDLSQSGDGELAEVKNYQITDDGYDDGSANIVIVYEAVKPGDVKLRLSAADRSDSNGTDQFLIDRKLTIAEDLTIKTVSGPSLENLCCRLDSDSIKIVKAHPQISGEVVIPESVSAIPEEFLKYCEGVTAVTLPERVSKIPASAFELCYGLKTLTILNPDCKIEDSATTITNSVDEEWKQSFDGVIRGYEGSTAQKYAEKYGYKFEEIKTETALDIEEKLPKTADEWRATVKKHGYVYREGNYVVFLGSDNGSTGYTFKSALYGSAEMELAKSCKIADPVPEGMSGGGILHVEVYKPKRAGAIQVESLTVSPAGKAFVEDRYYFYINDALEVCLLNKAVTEIDDILPKTRAEMDKFTGEYGYASVHGKYIVDHEGISGFYNNSGGVHSDPGNELASYELVQKGTGKIQFAKYLDFGARYPDDADLMIVLEACEPGEVEFMLTYGSSTKSCFIHRVYEIAEDLTITEKSVGNAEGFRFSTNTDGKSCTLSALFVGSDIKIPSELNGMTVTGIAQEAFFGASGLKTVVIPETVKMIGKDAFSHCAALEELTILNPECEIKIGEYDGTISNYYDEETKKETFNGVIRGYTGSTAEKYAKEHGFDFRPIDTDGPGGIEIIAGDANCDGKVTIADAAAILQYLGNADKYPLMEQGKKNADVDGEKGITTKDAVTIQLMAVKAD